MMEPEMNISRHCEEQSDEAIQSSLVVLDCFVASAPRNDGLMQSNSIRTNP